MIDNTNLAQPAGFCLPHLGHVFESQAFSLPQYEHFGIQFSPSICVIFLITKMKATG